jgi:hypothetical protein
MLTGGSKSSASQSTEQFAQNAINDSYHAVDDLDNGDPLSETEIFAAKSTVHSLFDNALISHERAHSIKNGINPIGAITTRRQHARQRWYSDELHALVPDSEDLKVLLKTSNSMRYSPADFEPIWRRALSPEMAVHYDGTMESVLKPLFESKNLIYLCKGLLYLALVLQQLPSDHFQHGLKFPDGVTGKDMVQRYIDTVDDYLLSNDRYSKLALYALKCMTDPCQNCGESGRA